MHNRDVIGKEVIGADAWRIGTVARLTTDPTTWQVTAIEVTLDESVVQELRTKGITPSSPMAVPIDRVEGISDKLVLRVKKEEFVDLAAQPSQQQASSPFPSATS